MTVPTGLNRYFSTHPNEVDRLHRQRTDPHTPTDWVTGSTIAMAASRPAPAQSRVVRIGSRIVAAALLVRGVGGLAVSALGVGQASDQFRQWDLRLYSPLCIALGACVAIGRRR